MNKTHVTAAAALLFLALPLFAQQANSASSTLTINGASSGAAPYSTSMVSGATMTIAVVGPVNAPFVLATGPLSIGNLVFVGGAGQIDIGPSIEIVIDGYGGSSAEAAVANCGSTGAASFCVPVSASYASAASVVQAFQSVIVDASLAPTYFAISAATELTVTVPTGLVANAGCDSTATTLESGVILDGSASSSGPAVTYLWTYTGSVAGVTIQNATSAVASFNVPAGVAFSATGNALTAATMTFQLAVSDGTSTDSDSVDIDVSISFANDVNPIFSDNSLTDSTGANARCINCHTVTAPSGLNLAQTLAQNYAAVIAGGNGGTTVNLANPAASRLITKPGYNIPNDLGHTGGSIFNGPTNTYYQTMLAWISQGAQNN